METLVTGTERRLVYVTNHRLPTEKAHGFQVASMCDAFARHGVDVVLTHPARHQSDVELRRVAVPEYYALPPTFRVERIPNLDVLRLSRVVPRRLLTVVNFAHSVAWSKYAARVASRHAGDIYYTREPVLAYWLLRAGLPTALEAHAAPRRIRRFVLRRIATHRRLKLVVVLTSHLRTRLIDLGFAPDRVVVHPDAVALERFRDLPSRDACRRKLGLPLGRPVVAYVGRFRALGMEKGIPELIRAHALQGESTENSPLLLCVGGPPEAVPDYRRLARATGVEDSVQFVDQVPVRDVPLWMRAADILTIPWTWNEFSAYFTSPLKLFEYMAAEVPILASDLPAIREVLTHGRNGWLVPPGDVPALAGGIRTLLTDSCLAGDLARRAREDVERFTWSERARLILAELGFESASAEHS